VSFYSVVRYFNSPEAINVSQRTYAYYECGQRMVPPHVLCALADFYKVSVDYLLGHTKN